MGRLGIDFGTSNTVLAVWDDAQKDGRPWAPGDLSRTLPSGGEDVPVVPSIIHFASTGEQWLGQQVKARNLYESAGTFCWMKTAISRRNPSVVRVDGRNITQADAGRDFLSQVLALAANDLVIGDEEVAFTVPVESFEHYTEWLGGVAEAAGIKRYRFIDEPSAAALGYGAHIQPGNVYAVFDFGGGTLDVAIVRIEHDEDSGGGRKCRVLGKAGEELGGSIIDQWLFNEVLKRNQKHASDDDVRQLSREMLVRCEEAKERLSSNEEAEVSVMNPETGAMIETLFTRSEFEGLLDERGAFDSINKTIRRALNQAVQRGVSEDDVHSVLMLGGSSLIPCVQKAVQGFFGQERVRLDRPLDAVARGAAAFVAGVDFYDHIHHDYAVRWVNPAKSDYEYRAIVPRGTAYPSKEAVARLSIKATYEGQKKLGIAIFEMGDTPRGSGNEQPVEFVFDPTGAARMRTVSVDEADRRARFWMNEHSPTFLEADPPGKPGEARFQVEFSIDGNKRLLITARDLRTQKLVLKDYPVVKLT
jgi:molecular chaperone DnaK